MTTSGTANQNSGPNPATESETAARCHEIQVCLGRTDVPEFESILEIGMSVRLALHIRGLPLIKYDVVRLVAVHYLDVPALAVQRIVELLAEIEFVKLQTEGKTIRAVLPTVPYYEDLYSTLGQFAKSERTFTEPEALSLELVRRLAKAPENLDTIRNDLGAEKALFKRTLQVGEEGAFIVRRRTRGRDILLSPTYFSENAETFAELVASSGAPRVQQALQAVRGLQGVPLSLLESGAVKVNGQEVPTDQVQVLRRLAQDGAVKPPSIRTTHSGEQHFLFTPTPTGAAMPATKRDVYERAMNLVAAVRQGQFLAKRYRIRQPGAILYTLQRDGRLGRATTEASEQYQNLVRHRVARLVKTGGGFAELHLIDTPENREALRIALELVDAGAATGVEVDEEARRALQMDQHYLESIVASGELRKRGVVSLTAETQYELDLILSGGA